MTRPLHRRDFLTTSAVVGLGGLGALADLAPAVAEDKPAPDLIPVDPEVESLVKLIYATPPDKIVGVMIEQVRKGLSYRRFLAANFVAGIRYHLGAHSIFVTHSVNQVALDVGREERLLPLFYHVAILRSESWKPQLKPIQDHELPAARRAAAVFPMAMAEGDKETASRALIALARGEGARQAFDRLWFYGAERNHNSGGHAAIAVTNLFRTLETIGWHHTEPVLQYLVEKECGDRAGGSDLHRINAERSRAVTDLPPEWLHRDSDRGAVLELLALFRKGDPAEACRTTFELLNQGKVQAGTVWDAVFLTTAELTIRFKSCGPSELAGHSVTCTNALHFAFRTVTDSPTRLYILLEAVEWTTSFLRRTRDKGDLRDLEITDISDVDSPRSVPEAVEEIFAMLPPRRFFDYARSARADQDQAMRLTYALAKKTRDHRPFLDTARRLLCLKSTRNVHDFKYPVALFEHYQYASAEWKPHLLAASAHNLHGTKMEDSPPVQQAREALGKL